MALAVEKACEAPSKFKFLYDVTDPIEKKIETIAKTIYGADGIEISEQAQEAINRYKKQGFNNMPICMAKTHLSLSADPDKKGTLDILFRQIRKFIKFCVATETFMNVMI